ncbi:MAG: hypothetical protein Q7T56_02450 [Nocardioidaceae bacterium]|nr:hypothetical protein [Nocardioidaceae bacterium]
MPDDALDDWDSVWADALDELELSVDAAERVLHGDDQPLPPWYPPLVTKPLPVSMLTRAQALLTRQVAVAESLAAASLGTRRQREVVARVSSATTTSRRPSYLDLST